MKFLDARFKKGPAPWYPQGSARGFTLVETLLTLLILMMVTLVVATGIPTATNALSKAMDAAHGQVLISTAMTVLRDELTTATEIEYGDVNEPHRSIIYKGENGRYSKIYLGKEDSPENVSFSEDTENSEDRWIWVKTIRKKLAPDEEPTWTVSPAEEEEDIEEDDKFYNHRLVSKSTATENLSIEYSEIKIESAGLVYFKGLVVKGTTGDIAYLEDTPYYIQVLGAHQAQNDGSGNTSG